MDGFFVMDFDMKGNEKDEFGLKGYVGLEGVVNLAIARGGVDGRLTLEAGVDMQDIGKSVLTKNANGYVTNVQFVSDGKIRGSELATMWNYQNGGLANLFNLSASVGIEANAFGDIRIPFKGWTNIFRETLFPLKVGQTSSVRLYSRQHSGQILTMRPMSSLSWQTKLVQRCT
jgi:hypothetical protein